VIIVLNKFEIENDGRSADNWRYQWWVALKKAILLLPSTLDGVYHQLGSISLLSNAFDMEAVERVDYLHYSTLLVARHENGGRC